MLFDLEECRKGSPAANSARYIRALALFVLAFAGPLSAQFSIDGYPVQVHGFFSQGFAYSNQNNYLTINTSQGSFAFTDAGLNASSQITDRFRVGAQAYVENIGNLGHGHVTLDWALGDYRFTNWFGIRAGKVKTVLGLYNDTQDEEFLHTWALLPQSMYPLDLRETSISHIGADLYGNISLHQGGNLSYTAYAGELPRDMSGGYNYGLQNEGLIARKISGSARGADLKWTTPLSGLLVGASFLNGPLSATTYEPLFGTTAKLNAFGDERTVFSGQYTIGNFKIEGEYSRELLKVNLVNIEGPFGPPVIRTDFDRRSLYAALAYRVSKHLELGTYNSRFFPDANRSDFVAPGLVLPPPARHIFDQVVSARIDVTRFVDFKIEGHFIDGYGDPSSFRGFYPADNPQGLKPTTNLLILRMGVNF